MRMRHRATTALAVLTLAMGPTGTALATDALDDAFLGAVHQGNMAEIAAGGDAQKNAVSMCVRETGKVLVRDHTLLDKGVEELGRKLKVALPRSVTPKQEQELKEIRKKARTRAYDNLWLRAQDTAHVQTLDLLDAEAARGKDATVREAARKARPIVAKHLEMVRDCMMHMPPRHR
ncbi:DUF4142 domain-containing protein [Streptomyces mobaraensis NBRC 13819 = DSM 40847]|uniref:DUF4142 domain-containing protein n=2 Tax=Streptomyces mobaraensis TaxID=35621 RepID=A0A5N5W4E0_STRMB|nr:DUF4142 domain-containing protein [Streptomyces mobaraensis]KAB7839921.1 DUF4142 domain-containing protein [Streptomyces mobaraensis]QTT72485.1 DUF4142 domain-containing protein [Streptomyces mobaraensis NBRC 13819 = DSM 40847]